MSQGLKAYQEQTSNVFEVSAVNRCADDGEQQHGDQRHVEAPSILCLLCQGVTSALGRRTFFKRRSEIVAEIKAGNGREEMFLFQTSLGLLDKPP